MSLALYRVHRPKKLDDLVGQETTVQILKNAAKTDRFAHAYLFYGPRGTGKTTTARLIAKLLNCEKRSKNPKFKAEGEPCNNCRSCAEIDAGNSFDVIEIDAASNRGIEEIRNLKESIRSSPTGSDYKVYIVDEIHMLTGFAFNALLKTLEEPPEHGVIVLATTEYEKLPPTITSRTQRFLFRKLAKAEILEKLKDIAKQEKIKIEPDALELIAAAGEGSLRDAISLLDQIRSAGGTIDVTTVEATTGRVGIRKVEDLIKLIVEENVNGALEYLEKVSEEGHNVVELTKNLIHYLRKVIALKTTPTLETSYERELTKDELKKMKSLAANVNIEKHIRLLRSLIRAYTEMRYSPFASVPLEVALIENLGKTLH